ncbi:hypothetical protein TNCV_236151 [Trichonephila clavipes]|nr:hypothetical protein TNCV_236151 [Trichonephila clavipes]
MISFFRDNTGLVSQIDVMSHEGAELDTEQMKSYPNPGVEELTQIKSVGAQCLPFDVVWTRPQWPRGQGNGLAPGVSRIRIQYH